MCRSVPQIAHAVGPKIRDVYLDPATVPRLIKLSLRPSIATPHPSCHESPRIMTYQSAVIDSIFGDQRLSIPATWWGWVRKTDTHVSATSVHTLLRLQSLQSLCMHDSIHPRRGRDPYFLHSIHVLFFLRWTSYHLRGVNREALSHHHHLPDFNPWFGTILN